VGNKPKGFCPSKSLSPALSQKEREFSATEKENNMPTYITLLNWTQQGIGKVKGSPKRLDEGRKAFKKAGVEIKDVYLTLGRCDLVCVIEAPNDEAYAKAILSLASQGNVSTETLKAFSEDQYRKITGSL
jgi:uncharacterized protein with GYD domain